MSVSFEDVYRLSLQLSPDERQRLADYLLNPPPALTADEIVSTLESHTGDLREMGVQQLGVFGSYARGEADPASDIDLLVTLDEPSFRQFMRLKFYLEDVLSHPVDLVLGESLREELRPAVLREVLYVKGL
jgi:predicted nucleotidyltransferase